MATEEFREEYNRWKLKEVRVVNTLQGIGVKTKFSKTY